MATKKDEPSTEVAETKPSAGAIANVNAEALALMADDDNVDQIDMRDITIPFIQILQSLSPQLDEQAPEYIEGAKVGQIINTATNELYDGKFGVGLIPIHYSRRFTEWVPRNKGGGLVADYGTDESCLARATRSEDTGKDTTPEGNEIITAGTFYVLVVDLKNFSVLGRGVVSMVSTQFKKAKRWNAMITNFQLPRPGGGRFTPKMYACLYRATSVPESNDQGRWSGWKIEPFTNEDGSRMLTVQLPDGAEIYGGAQEFRKQVDAGEVRAAEPAPATQRTDDADGDIPF